MFSKMELKPYPSVIFCLLMLFFLLFPTCSENDPSGLDENFSVQLDLVLPKLENASDPNATIDVVSVTVTAEGEPFFDEFTETLAINGNTATGSIEVLKGENRKFNVLLLTSGVTIFCGSQTIDILGETFDLDFQFSQKCKDIATSTLSEFTFSEAGNGLAVSWTTSNTGVEPISEAFDDDIWLSTTPGTANQDVLLGTFRHASGLSVNASVPVTLDVTIPSPLPAAGGLYSIFVLNDGKGEVQESDETNNDFLSDITLLGTGDLRVTLTWDTGPPVTDSTDIDIHIIEPDGSHVYWGNDTGTTTVLDVDNIAGFGPENIFVDPTEAAAGTYDIYVVYFDSEGSPAPVTEATIELTVFEDTGSEDTQTFTRTLTAADDALGLNVATVTFPGGIITETVGSRGTDDPEDLNVNLNWDNAALNLDVFLLHSLLPDTIGIGVDPVVVESALAGTYGVYVLVDAIGVTNAEFNITAFANTVNENPQTFNRVINSTDIGYIELIATVEYPAGTITEIPEPQAKSGNGFMPRINREEFNRAKTSKQLRKMSKKHRKKLRFNH